MYNLFYGLVVVSDCIVNRYQINTMVTQSLYSNNAAGNLDLGANQTTGHMLIGQAQTTGRIDIGLGATRSGKIQIGHSTGTHAFEINAETVDSTSGGDTTIKSTDSGSNVVVEATGTFISPSNPDVGTYVGSTSEDSNTFVGEGMRAGVTKISTGATTGDIEIGNLSSNHDVLVKGVSLKVSQANFLPVIGGTSGSEFTTSVKIGTYFRWGGVWVITVACVWSSKGTAAGDFKVTSFPCEFPGQAAVTNDEACEIIASVDNQTWAGVSTGLSLHTVEGESHVMGRLNGNTVLPISSIAASGRFKFTLTVIDV